MHSVNVKDLNLSFGPVDVLQNLNIDINDGEFLVLLGSSGCGKSTLLNCIAGLLDITDGQVFIKGRNVTWDEPSKRGIGMVFQSYALYPQMSVEGNLSFGLKNAKMPAAEIAKRVNRAAEILQIGPLLKRKPAALSGGQRQRVAIGRALVRDVDVFLFDEPLSNLDAKLRADLRVELKQLHRQLKNTMIYVTHDQVEAMTLGHRLVLMNEGRIEQIGQPLQVYELPETLFVAGFIGSPPMNLVPGELNEKGEFILGSTVKIKLDDFQTKSKNLTLGIRPEHLLTDESGKVTLGKFIVENYERQGADNYLYGKINGLSHSLITRVHADTIHSVGSIINLSCEKNKLHLFCSDTGLRVDNKKDA